MNEREEFSLPGDLEQTLSKPLTQTLPSSELLARRAIVLSREIRASRTERTVHVIGAILLGVAIARMGVEWLFEHPVSGEFVLTMWRSVAGLMGLQSWLIVLGGVLTGGLIFMVSRARKTLSE